MTKQQRSAAARKAAATRRRNAAARRAEARDATSPAEAEAAAAAAVVDRELGAGSWSYFGDPRAISHDGHTFTGWISTTGNVWVARYTAGGRLTKRADLQGPGTRRPQQPVARLPPRRAHRRVLLAALRAPPAAARHPERDAVHGLAEPVLDRRLRPRAHRSDQRARRPGLHLSQPDPAQGQAVAVLARRRVEPDLLLHRERSHWVPARELVLLRSARSARTRSTSATATAEIHGIFTDGHPTNWKTGLHYLRYEAGNLYAMSGRRIGSLRSVPFHTSKLDHIYNYSDRGGRAWPHDIALTVRGPAADRLHAASGEPRHLLLRVPQRHEVGQPQDRRGGPRPPVVPLGRRVARPRGPAHRLSVAHDRPRGTRSSSGSRRTRGGRGRRASSPTTPTATRSGRSRRAGCTAANRILYVWGDERTIGFTDYTTRIHALDF